MKYVCKKLTDYDFNLYIASASGTFSINQGSYRPWKVLEKGIGPGKPWKSQRITNLWNSLPSYVVNIMISTCSKLYRRHRGDMIDAYKTL